MKKSLQTTFLISGLLTVLFAKNAFAHALWVEKAKDGSAAVFFGEYGEGLREKSGGRLDEVSHLEAWSIGPDGHKTPLKPGKTEDRFILETTDIAIIAQDTSLPVKDMRKYKLSIAKPNLYARLGTAAHLDLKPELRLDILPAADGSGKVRLFFDGKPLPGEKVALIAPNGWMKELKSDEEGWVKLDQPWPGLYVAEVTHVVEKPGNFMGENYEVERHRATLSLEKA